MAQKSIVIHVVLDLEQQSDDSWIVKTDKGDIHCEHVVCCTGNFARKTGEMVGLDIPVIPVEHQYIVTDPHPDILARKAAGLPEQAVLRESDAVITSVKRPGVLFWVPTKKTPLLLCRRP